MTWREGVELFAVWIAAKAPNTRLQYENSMRKLSEFFGGREIESITPVAIAEYQVRQMAAGFSAATINRDSAVLSKLLRVLEGEGVPVTVRKIPRHRENRRTRFLEKDEVSRLLGAATGEMRVAITLGIFTGMRKSEVFGLKWERVDLVRNRIDVTGKGGKHLSIPVSEGVREALTELTVLTEPGKYVKRSAKGYVFKQGRWHEREWIRLKKQCGFGEDVCFHTLRHTFCSWLVMNGVDIKTVQELAGHSSLATTEKYLHITDKSRQEGIDKLWTGLSK